MSHSKVEGLLSSECAQTNFLPSAFEKINRFEISEDFSKKFAAEMAWKIFVWAQFWAKETCFWIVHVTNKDESSIGAV